MGYSFIPNVEKRSVGDLVNLVGDRKIFNYFFPYFTPEDLFVSPFREDDTKPGCFIWEGDETKSLFFVDYADPERSHYNALGFLIKYFDSDYQKIRDFFSSNFPNEINSIPSESPVGEGLTPKQEGVKNPIQDPLTLRFATRSWDKRDKIFWEKYGITRKQLEEDLVFPIKGYQISKKDQDKVFIHTFDRCYTYTLGEDFYKIYRPDNKDHKWFTNANASVIGNIDNIDPKGDMLVITKSYKDCRVLRNLGYKNTVWFQAEAQIPKVEKLVSLCQRFSKVCVFFDNDETGVSRSAKLVNFINMMMPEKANTFTLPPLEGVKDASDYYEKYGEQKLKNILKFQ